MQNSFRVKKHVKTLRDDVLSLAMEGKLVNVDTGEIIENPLVNVHAGNGHFKASSHFMKIMHKGENAEFLRSMVEACGEYSKYFIVLPCYCYQDNEFDVISFREEVIKGKSSFFRFRRVMLDNKVLVEIGRKTYLNPRIAFYGETINTKLLEAVGHDYKSRPL